MSNVRHCLIFVFFHPQENTRPGSSRLAYTRLVWGSLVPSPHRGGVMVARKPALYNELRGVVGLFTHPPDHALPALTHSKLRPSEQKSFSTVKNICPVGRRMCSATHRGRGCSKFQTAAAKRRVGREFWRPTTPRQRVFQKAKTICAAALRMCDGTSKSPSHPRSRGD
jgi:hypothetical protein